MSEDKQRILDALESAVEEIRYRAVKRMFEVFDEPPIDQVIRALGDSSWRVRKCVSDILVGTVPSPGLISALIVSLGEEENAGLRNSATEVLVKVGAPAVEPLLKVLEKGDKDERKLAADTLGDIADGRALDSLVKSLRDDDENVRAAAAEALGKLGDSGVADRLIEVLQGDGLLVQLSCLDALDRLGIQVSYRVLAGFLDVGPLRPHLFRLMGSLPDLEVIPKLLEGLQARGRMERVAATQALVRQYRAADQRKRVEIQVSVGRASSDQVIDSLLAILESSSKDEREAATVVLGWTGREDVVIPLVMAAAEEHLRDLIFEAILSIGPKAADLLCKLPENVGRAEKVLAVELLGHFGISSTLPTIVDLSLSEDHEVAEAAQHSLGQIGNPAVISTLTGLLGREADEPPRGVVASLAGLGVKFHDEVVSAMKPLLEEDRTSLRVAAAEVLCAVARKTDLGYLARLIGDGNSSIRAAAVRALGRVGDDAAVEKLRMALADESPEVRAATARALGNRDTPDARSALKVALRDGDPWVVKETLAALGQSANPGVEEAILPFVGHGNGAVALEAIRALNRLGWQGDASLLLEASRHPDPEVVKEVLDGCDRWPIEEVRQILMGALGDSHWDVRMAAVKKIGALKDPAAVQAVYERLRIEEDDLVKEAMERILEVGERGSASDAD